MAKLADEFLKLYPAPTDDAAKVAQYQSARDVARTTLYVWAIDRARTAKTRRLHVLLESRAAWTRRRENTRLPHIASALRSSTPSNDPTGPSPMSTARSPTSCPSYWVNFVTSGDPNGKAVMLSPPPVVRSTMAPGVARRRRQDLDDHGAQRASARHPGRRQPGQAGLPRARPVAPMTTHGPPALDVGRAIDQGRWSGYQRWLVFLTALTIIFDGIDNQLLGITIPSIMAEWHVPRSAFAPVVALGFLGMMIGGAAAGLAGDRFGRRDCAARQHGPLRRLDAGGLERRQRGGACRAAADRRHRARRRHAERRGAGGGIRPGPAPGDRGHLDHRLRAARRHPGRLDCHSRAAGVRLAGPVHSRWHRPDRGGARPRPRCCRNRRAISPPGRSAGPSCAACSAAWATTSPPTPRSRPSKATRNQPPARRSMRSSPRGCAATPSRSGRRSSRACCRSIWDSAGCRRS